MALRLRKDRRRNRKLVFIERRKGKLWIYGQMFLLPTLMVWLAWLVKG